MTETKKSVDIFLKGKECGGNSDTETCSSFYDVRCLFFTDAPGVNSEFKVKTEGFLDRKSLMSIEDTLSTRFMLSETNTHTHSRG